MSKHATAARLPAGREPPAPALHRRTIAAVLLLAAALLVGLWSILAVDFRRTRARTIERAETTLHDVARATAQHAARTLDALDYVVRSVRAEFVAQQATGNPTTWQRDQSSITRRALTITVADASGLVVLTTDSSAAANASIAEREDFRVLRDEVADRLMMSAPVARGTQAQTAMSVSRRITGPDGSFRGIAVVSIDPVHLLTFYRSLDFRTGLVIAVADATGRIWARGGETEAELPANFADPDLIARFRDSGAESFTMRGQGDEEDRLLAVRRVAANLPLFVVVGQSRATEIAAQAVDHRPYIEVGLFGTAVIGFFSVLVMTQLRRLGKSQSALRENEERFRDFVDAGSHFVWETDAELRVALLSGGVERIWGEPPNRFHGWAIERLVDGSVDGSGARSVASVLEWREPFMDIIVSRPLADGGTVYIAWSGKPVVGASGHFVGYRGTGRDVTAEVTAQRAIAEAQRHRDVAEAASVAKTRFLAHLSHELRTPLNAIIGFSEVMKEQIFGPLGNTKYQQYSSDISSSAHHLLELINDLLEISRIEFDKRPLDLLQIAIGEVIIDSVGMVDHLAKSSGIRLEVHKARFATPVRVDVRAIKQVLLNILSNAIKFTPSGGLIRLEVAAPSRGQIEIVVTDSGVGIAKDKIATLFEPFQQANADQAREKGGSGLGLWISRQLVRLHQGDIVMESVEGGGTSIRICLPVAENVVAQSA